MTWISSTGKFHAYKGDKFTQSHKAWMVINCDKSIMAFYLKQIERAGYEVSPPLAGSHISVVRNENVLNWDKWEEAIGSKASFEYLPIVKTNGKHWWLQVRSAELEAYRVSFGLSPLPYFPFHLTVAVASKIEPIVQQPISEEALKEVIRLQRMRAALPSFAWEVSSEKELLKTLEKRYFVPT